MSHNNNEVTSSNAAMTRFISLLHDAARLHGARPHDWLDPSSSRSWKDVGAYDDLEAVRAAKKPGCSF